MNILESDDKEFQVELLPHQRAFVEACFSPSSSRVIELQASVGLGKTIALMVVATRLIRDQPEARVLILSPAALRSQFVKSLMQANVNAVLLDRYKYRELLDSSNQQDIWPIGTIFIASLDFVKLEDIRASLASIAWNLVIVDESHNLSGARARALEQFATSASRVVLASVPDLDTTEVFLAERSTKLSWKRDQIIGEDGEKIGAGSRPTLHELVVNLSPAEMVLINGIESLSQLIGAEHPLREILTKSLYRSFVSSPAALERTLRRLTTQISNNDFESDDLQSVPYPLASEIEGDSNELPRTPEITKAIDQSLRELEEVSEDSKLKLFDDLLIGLNKSTDPPSKICVITDYLATLFYLAAYLEDKGVVFHLMHGGIKADERRDVLDKLLGDPAILLATRASMVEGFDLPEFTDLVLYDVPKGRNAIELVLARFDRFGRQNPVHVHVFAPPGPVGAVPNEPLIRLRELSQHGTKS